MWRSGISRESILGMAFFYPLRICQHPKMIILDGIRISRESTSVIQDVEVDDMTTGVLEGPPSSLVQYTSGFYWWYTFAVQPLLCHPQEYVLEHGARGVKRGTRKLPGGGAHGGCASAPPYPGGRGREDLGDGGEKGGGSGGWGRGDAPKFSLGLAPVALSYPSGVCTSHVPPDPFDSPDASYIQPPPSVGDTSYAPSPPSAVVLSFDAPLPSSITGSSVPHIPISRASSFDSNEYGDEPADDVKPAQQLGFGHRVGKRLLDLLHQIGVRV
ncbi:hypothetical protein M9H77_18316 [Catharanthus roseus]|uniref:Uncharacterized protein n=1 Tax=Catharanthus roseus TaxID=4058 RepID=A0ACC0B744_CATRO|nr:hypothetical protein M9H77_18316 [Catharanthus roseus]